MIELRNLSKKYKDQVIFNNFNYSFDSSQFYLIFGYSGCGKTTLVNMIMKIIPYDEGSIFVDGVDIRTLKIDDLQHKIAYMTQDSYFIDYLTVKEHLQIHPESYDLAVSYLEKFHLLDTLDRYPGSLSGGEKQRISIIKELVEGKKIFILDEPTSSLDKENKIEVFRLLEQISNDVLVICVSHDEKAKKYAHVIVDLNRMKAIRMKDSIQNHRPAKELKSEKKRALNRLVFRKKDHERKSRIILCGILITFILFISFCLSPTEKLINSLGDLYHLNYLNAEIRTENLVQEVAKLKENDEITDIVYQYSRMGNYHEPIMKGTTDISDSHISRTLVFPTLPLSDSFYYKDYLFAGEYFSEPYEIMLGFDYAQKLSLDMKGLIGKEIELETGYGIEKFKISGIFKRFENETLEYFKNGFSLDSLNLAGFFNEKYSYQYAVDDQTSKIEKEIDRSFVSIYFRSFYDLNNFLEMYKDVDLYSEDSIYVYPIENFMTRQINEMKRLELIGLPIAGFALIISLLFYIQINYIKLEKNTKEFAIYRYFEYSWKEIRNAHVSYYIYELFKMIFISTCISILLIYCINWLNSLYRFYPYTIFIVSYPLFIFPVALLLLGMIMNFIMIQKFRKINWYDVIKKKRDLL